MSYFWLTKSEADALLFDQGRGATWTNADGSRWGAYFFRWNQGPSWSSDSGSRGPSRSMFSRWRLHSLRGITAGTMFKQRASRFLFMPLDFDDGVRKSYVFFCLWEDGVKSSDRSGQQDRWIELTRLRSVLLGQRSLGQQTLQIVISGSDGHV
jgi:hypothetical protein